MINTLHLPRGPDKDEKCKLQVKLSLCLWFWSNDPHISALPFEVCNPLANADQGKMPSPVQKPQFDAAP